MSPDTPRKPTDEDREEAGPDASRRASSPLYAAGNPSLLDDEDLGGPGSDAADDEEE